VALEQNDGDVERWVKGYIQHLTSADSGDFKSFTNPGAEDIEEAIDVAEAEIVSWLAEAGYSTDTSAYPALAKRYLSWYNAVGAAYRLEMYHPGVQFGPGANTRFDRLHELLMELYRRIMEGGITGLGIPVSAGASIQPLFTGGSHTGKQVQEDDTDAVQPFFRRRSFQHPQLSDRPSRDPAIRP
jgi:hypothetical protein